MRVVQREIHRTNACFGFPWRSSPHGLLMFNVGVYGTPHGGAAAYDPVDLNREVERFVSDRGGRKMLYAQTFYTREEFWELFDLGACGAVRQPRCESHWLHQATHASQTTTRS